MKTIEEALEHIWDALCEAREQLDWPDEQWDALCEAMAWVSEDTKQTGADLADDALKSTMALAYGELWHITHPNSKRVEAARHLLRDAIGAEYCRWGIKRAD